MYTVQKMRELKLGYSKALTTRQWTEKSETSIVGTNTKTSVDPASSVTCAGGNGNRECLSRRHSGSGLAPHNANE